LAKDELTLSGSNPTDPPSGGALLPIESLYRQLQGLIHSKFHHIGSDQERNRGAALHQLVCSALGYKQYGDNGRFPDVRHQLLEVKLQTSPTIDLGLVSPTSIEPLDIPQIGDIKVRHCDIRYAIFFGTTNGTTVTLTHFYLTTGQDFFKRFQQFQGKVVNAKIQIPLPHSLFE
jgi:hypothetical protein